MNIATNRYGGEGKVWVAAPMIWDFKFVDGRDETGIQFIDRVELNVIISAMTQGGGGAAAPVDIHNMLSSITLKANDGKAWGPSQVSAQQIDESRFLASGRALSVAYDINGDATINAGAGPSTRAFKVVFDFNAYGRPGTYTPAAAFFNKTGVLTVQGATPSNTSLLTAIVTPNVYTHGEPKLRAVPRITLTAAQISATSYNLNGQGMLLQHFLENAANWVAADLTTLTLKGPTGTMMSELNVLASRDESYAQNPEVTASQLLRHFCDPVGGTAPRAIPVFPPAPTYEGIGSLPTGDAFTVKWQGAETPTNITQVSVFAEVEDKQLGDLQLIAQGASRDAIASTVSDVPGGVVHNDRIRGYIGRTLSTPSKVK